MSALPTSHSSLAPPPIASCQKCSSAWNSAKSALPALTTARPKETFETEFTARSNAHRGYITIIEGCDKFCAYCVVPYTRGKERSRTSTSVLAEARRMADSGYTEIQLLGQNVNSYHDIGREEVLRRTSRRSR